MPVQLSGSLLMSGSITATGLISAQGGISSVGAQQITDLSNAISFTSTASLYTNGGARITKDLYVSGTSYFNNVTIYGTQSVQYITSSQLNIGTNIITVNTDTPTVRYGGIAVYDSGSTGLTGSLLWDSEANHWIYTNPSGSTYSGGMMISGPRSSARGCEQGTTSCALMMGQGGDHITSSGIFHYGNATCFYGNATITSTGVGCFTGTICAPTVLSSGTICSTGNTCFGGATIIAGCLGVGTSTPSNRLDVNGNINVSSTNFFRYEGDTGLIGSGTSITGGASTQLGIRAANDVLFATNGANERMRITCAGNVGIGCNTPTNSRLLVAGTHVSGNSILGVVPVSNNVATIGLYNSSGVRTALFYSDTGFVTVETDTDPLLLRTAGTNRLSISSTGIACFACQTCTPALDIMPSGAGVNTAGGILRVITGGTAVGIGVGQSNTNRYTQISANDLLVYNDDFFIATRCAFPLSIGTCYTSRLTFAATGIACFACQVCMPVLLASGCVGIGTTSPQSRLNVAGAKTNSADLTTITNQLAVTDTTATAAGVGGRISFLGAYTATPDYFPFGSIEVLKDNANNYGGAGWNNAAMRFIVGNNDNDAQAGRMLERMRITSGGNVGIGTNSPVTFGTRNLDVNAGSGGAAYIVARANSNAGTAELAFDTDAGYLSTKSNHPLVIRTNDIRRMCITGAGTVIFECAGIFNTCVGIGTTSPGYKLDVQGVGRFQNSDGSDLIRYTATGVNTEFATKIVSGANDVLVFRRQHSTQGALDIMALGYNGNVGIGTTSPTATLDIGSAKTLSGTDPISVYTDVRVQSAVTGGLIGYNLRMVGLSPAVGSYTIANMYGLKTNTPVVQPNVTVTNSYGVYIGRTDDPSSGGVVTNKYALVTEAAAGNVGIGTTTPAEKFVVSETTNPSQITLKQETNFNSGIIGQLNYIGGGTGAKSAMIESNRTGGSATNAFRGGDLRFYTKVDDTFDCLVERMRITNGGEVGIGVTPTAGNAFWVKGRSTSSGDTAMLAQNSAGTNLFYVLNNGDVVMPNGNVGIGTTSICPSFILHIAKTCSAGLANMSFDNTAGVPCDTGTQGTILRFRTASSDVNMRTMGAIASYAMKNIGSGINNHGDLRFYTGVEGEVCERMRIASTGVTCFVCTICAPLIVAPGTPLQVVYGKTVISSGGGLMSLGPIAAGTTPQYNCGCLITSVSFTPKRSNSIILIQTNNVSMWETQNMSDHFYLWSSNETDGTVLAKSGGYIQNLNCLSSGTHGAIVNLNEGACSWGTTAKTIAFRIGTTGNNGCFYQVNPSYAAAGFDSSTVGQFSYTIMEIAQ